MYQVQRVDVVRRIRKQARALPVYGNDARPKHHRFHSVHATAPAALVPALERFAICVSGPDFWAPPMNKAED